MNFYAPMASLCLGKCLSILTLASFHCYAEEVMRSDFFLVSHTFRGHDKDSPTVDCVNIDIAVRAESETAFPQLTEADFAEFANPVSSASLMLASPSDGLGSCP